MSKKFSFVYRGQPFSEERCQNIITEGEITHYYVDDTLVVHLEEKRYPEYDAVKWVLWFENPGSTNSGILEEIRDCDMLVSLPESKKNRPGYLQREEDRWLVSMKGCVPGEMYAISDPISATEFSFEKWRFWRGYTRTFECRGGRSSDDVMPFFEMKSQGQGAILAIGWTGDWRAEFSEEKEGFHVTTGLQAARFYLEPGEKLRTSSTLLMMYKEGEDSSNKFRRLLREHVSHLACTPADREGLMACEMWGGLPSEEIKRRLRQMKEHGIRFEDLWMDAGWYGQCTKCDEPFTGDWGEATGDWEVNQRVHPGNLLDVRDTAQDAGMNMMLWFEIERAGHKTKAVAEHPDWFLRDAKRMYERRGALLLNYGNREAWDYAYRLLDDYITRLQMSCYRQDFNFPPTDYFRDNDTPDRLGVTEIKHILGVYRLFDRLLEAHPGLLIDNCSSGGRRIDIEMLQRSIAFFRSDYQCAFNATPEVLQVHNTNISQWLPLAGCTNKNSPSDRYSMRSSYSPSWGGAFYNAIFQTMSEEDFAAAREVCEEYKSIRKYLSREYYNHGATTLDDSAWAIWQYHDPEENAGVIMAFRRKNSPFDRATISIKGSASEEFSVESLDDGSLSKVQGTVEICLPKARSSCILKYRGI